MENVQVVVKGKVEKLRLPVIGESLNSAFSFSVLGRVTFPVVIELISYYEENELFDLINNQKITTAEDLSAEVLKENIVVGLELISTIAWFKKLIDLEVDEQRFDVQDQLMKNESIEQYFLRVFLSDPDYFVDLVHGLRFNSSGKMTSFKLFKPNGRLGANANKSKTITNEQLDKAKSMCAEHFTSREYGSWSGVYKYQSENYYGFFMERGGGKNSKANINTYDKPEIFTGRNLHCDIVFFDIYSQTIWVSCRSKEDAIFYVQMIQIIFFGEGISFTEKMSMNFNFVTADALRNHVQAYQSEKIERLSIVKAHYKSFGIENDKGSVSCSKKDEECLTDPEFTKFNELRKTSKAINKLEFTLKLKDENGSIEDIELSADRIRFSDRLQTTEIVSILNYFGVIERYTNA